MDRWLQSLAAASLGIALLYFGRSVVVPLAVAVLFSVVLTPLVRRLEHLGIGRFALGRIPAVLIVSAAVAAGFLAVGWLVGTQGRALAEHFPEYRRVLIDKLHEIREPIASLQRAAREVEAAATPPDPPAAARRVEVVSADSKLLGFLHSWVGSLASLIGTAGLVVVLLIFLLIEREDLRNRLIRVAGLANMRVATSALGDATRRMGRYVRSLTLLNLGHGAIVGTGLWILGLPGAPLFGLLAALMRFVPYVGPWVAALAPITLSIAVSDTWTIPLVIAGMFTLLELISDYAFEPWLLGTSVGLSPFGVILAAIFWAWLWGPIGLVLSTPLTVCLVVLGRHFSRFSGLSVLLSDSEPLQPAERLYQRLIARDIDEATDLVEERCEEVGALSAWDEVVLPALCLLDRDQQRRLLEPDELECARDVIEVLLAGLPEARTEAREQGVQAIHCLPARGWSDEFACRALARFLEASGLRAVALGRMLTGELAERVAAAQAPAVCIWSLDPIGSGAVRHLLTRVRNSLPKAEIVVGACGDAPWLSGLRERVRSDPRAHVVESLASAQERLLGVASP
jgi:predicted PurR-regulated permease PerM